LRVIKRKKKAWSSLTHYPVLQDVATGDAADAPSAAAMAAAPLET